MHFYTHTYSQTFAFVLLGRLCFVNCVMFVKPLRIGISRIKNFFDNVPLNSSIISSF